MIEYKHPLSGAPITNIKLVTPSAADIKRTQTKQQLGCEFVSVFISFSFVNREDELQDLQRRGKLTGFDSLDLSDYSSERHAYVLCPVVRNGSCCLRTGKIRDSAMIHHRCDTLTQRSVLSIMRRHDPNPRQSSVSPPSTPTFRAELQELLMEFIAGTPISFRLIGSPQFRSLLHGIITVSRQYPSVSPQALLPSLTVHAVPKMLRERASTIFSALLRKFTNSYVSIHIDSAVITHASYLAVTLRRCEDQSPIVPIQLLAAPSDRSGYAKTLYNVICFLRIHNIFVVSICCDGALAQVSGIHDVQQALYTEQLPPDKRSPIIPLHIPCFNHRINLALRHATSTPALSRTVEALQSFASQSGTKQYREVLQKTCPSFVQTRWFSLWNIASFIRLNRMKILQGTLLPHQTIEDIVKAEILFTPFTELTLFFESDKVQLSAVYPAILRALTQFSYIAANSYFSTGEWLHATIECMVQIFNYCLSGTIGYLIAVAFWLHPYGRYLYQTNRILSCYRLDQALSESFSLQFVYHFSFNHSLFLDIHTVCLPSLTQQNVFSVPHSS